MIRSNLFLQPNQLLHRLRSLQRRGPLNKRPKSPERESWDSIFQGSEKVRRVLVPRRASKSP